MNVVTIFFFLSGFSSLVYQTVWLRLFMAGFGVTAPVISSVLSVFMLGLALGSLVGGRFADRLQDRPWLRGLRPYALAELVIGIGGVSVPWLIHAGRAFVLTIPTTNSSAYFLLSFLVILLSLLPFCAAMGATYPLALAYVKRLPASSEDRFFSRLYLVNVVGSAAGTMLTAFFLIELLGFSNTLWVAATINLVIFLGGILTPVPPWESKAPSAGGPDEGRRASSPETGGIPWVPKLALFLLGFCCLGMEVVWARLFTPYIGQEVYAFALMLAVYLLFTAIGTSMYRRWFNAASDDRLWYLWFLAGPGSVLALVACNPDLALVGFGRVFLGVAPISFLTGALTPFLIDRITDSDPERVGQAYGVNLIGCIIGPLVAGFFLIPHLGNLVAGGLLVIGFWLTSILGSQACGSRRAGAVTSTAALAIVGLVFCLLAGGFAKTFEMNFPASQVRHDYSATVVVDGEGMSRNLLVNGMGMTNLTTITKLMAHIPLASLNHKPEAGLIICLGMGTTLRAMTKWNIDTTVVELTPSVADFLPSFFPDLPKFMEQHADRVRISIDDGRRFLDRGSSLYDVITLDPPPPVSAAASSLLYSVEFYQSVKRRLKPNGLLQTWIPGGDGKVLAAVSEALHRSFPHVRQFLSIEGWGYHFLASSEPIPRRSAQELLEAMNEEVRADLSEWLNQPPLEILERYVKQEVDPKGFLQNLPVRNRQPMTDDCPYNEYFLLRQLSRALYQYLW